MSKTVLNKIKRIHPSEGVAASERRSFPGDIILRGGISGKEYKEILPEIDRKNREMLLLESIICGIMFTGLLIESFYSQLIKDAVIYYSFMAAACVCLAVLSATTVRKHPRLVLWLWYALYVFFRQLCSSAQYCNPSEHFCNYVMCISGGGASSDY